MNKKKIAYNTLISLAIIQIILVGILWYLTVNRRINAIFFLAVMLMAIIPNTFLIIEMIYTILNHKGTRGKKINKQKKII